MYSNEKIDIKIPSVTAYIMGFIPTAFKSFAEMAEPTRDNVIISKRLADASIRLVTDSGKM